MLAKITFSSCTFAENKFVTVMIFYPDWFLMSLFQTVLVGHISIFSCLYPVFWTHVIHYMLIAYELRAVPHDYVWPYLFLDHYFSQWSMQRSWCACTPSWRSTWRRECWRRSLSSTTSPSWWTACASATSPCAGSCYTRPTFHLVCVLVCTLHWLMLHTSNLPPSMCLSLHPVLAHVTHVQPST